MSEGKTIEHLRAALFEAIEGVKSGSLPVDRARVINELAGTLTATAKVEVDYLRANDGGESRFLESAVGAGNLPPGLPGPGDAPTSGIAGITRHVLRG